MSSNTTTLRCASCATTLAVATNKDGYVEECVVQEHGWYYSGNRNAFFCAPCNKRETNTLLQKLFALCAERGVQVSDLRGNVLLPGKDDHEDV